MIGVRSDVFRTRDERDREVVQVFGAFLLHRRARARSRECAGALRRSGASQLPEQCRLWMPRPNKLRLPYLRPEARWLRRRAAMWAVAALSKLRWRVRVR